ncbi:response regulator transcription factor [Rhodoferax saidenbachensis]|uniref:Two-component system response regulator n=1 Tax=Rhodoferax saidenbachensis TaxID=1484693 RepID=A0A1P8KB32_9BURK|nr:response regulator transcription factor [Rhodoferax saidenbachensis]APW43208.1 two-component system response regulator [Rhodoferax saidenbachensis]
MHLLLVEDDLTLRATLQRSLSRSGMRVDVCHDGALALPLWQSLLPDVVVLDLNLPNVDGLDVLRSARQASLDTPVLLLTARGTVGDKVLGLNAGADDYLPKPFDLDELEARVRALHRRHSNSPRAPAEDSVRVGPLRFEPANGAMYLRQDIMDVTPRELALLRALMAKPGHAVAKERLFEIVFPGEDHVHYEAIEVVVHRLRKKLADTGVTLMTLRGLGYLLKASS